LWGKKILIWKPFFPLGELLDKKYYKKLECCVISKRTINVLSAGSAGLRRERNNNSFNKIKKSREFGSQSYYAVSSTFCLPCGT